MAQVMVIGKSSGGIASAKALARVHACELFIEVQGHGNLALLPAAPSEEAAWTFIPVEPLFEGGHHGLEGGEWLFCVGLWVPTDQRQEFLRWYEEDHLPILLQCATWDGCRFVEAQTSRGCQFYALHQLSERSALESPERARSRTGPGFERLKRFPWFDGPFTRTLYRRFDGE